MNADRELAARLEKADLDRLVSELREVASRAIPTRAARYRKAADAISSLRSQIERVEKERDEAREGWRDIETAPKDGTPILAFNIRHPMHPPVVVRWSTDPVPDIGDEPHWCDAATNDGSALYFNGHYFSHWRYVPAPPSAQKAQDNG